MVACYTQWPTVAECRQHCVVCHDLSRFDGMERHLFWKLGLRALDLHCSWCMTRDEQQTYHYCCEHIQGHAHARPQHLNHDPLDHFPGCRRQVLNHHARCLPGTLAHESLEGPCPACKCLVMAYPLRHIVLHIATAVELPRSTLGGCCRKMDGSGTAVEFALEHLEGLSLVSQEWSVDDYPSSLTDYLEHHRAYSEVPNRMSCLNYSIPWLYLRR